MNRKAKQPPTSLELLERFKAKCPGLPESVYQQVHAAVIEARTTVTLAKDEMELENQSKPLPDYLNQYRKAS